jgi:hypothetical protein
VIYVCSERSTPCHGLLAKATLHLKVSEHLLPELIPLTVVSTILNDLFPLGSAQSAYQSLGIAEISNTARVLAVTTDLKEIGASIVSKKFTSYL